MDWNRRNLSAWGHKLPEVIDLIQTIDYIPTEVIDLIQTINYLPPEVFT